MSQRDDVSNKSKARGLLDKIEAFQDWSSIWSLVATLAAAITAGVLTFMSTYAVSPKTAETSYELFKKSAMVALNIDSLTLSNAELLYQGATSKLKDDPELMIDLRKALVRMHLEIMKESGLLGSEIPGQVNSAKKIREIISEIDKVSPYHGLPATERNLIEDINLLHQDSNIKSKLDQLAVLIGARQDELQKTQSQARWSLILAVAGIAGTMVSVAMSLTQVFRKRDQDIKLPME